MWCIYTTRHLSAIKRWNVATCDNTEGSWEYHVKQKKPEGKRQEPYIYTHMWDIKPKATTKIKQTHRNRQQYSGYKRGRDVEEKMRRVKRLKSNLKKPRSFCTKDTCNAVLHLTHCFACTDVTGRAVISHKLNQVNRTFIQIARYKSLSKCVIVLLQSSKKSKVNIWL